MPRAGIVGVREIASGLSAGGRRDKRAEKRFRAIVYAGPPEKKNRTEIMFFYIFSGGKSGLRLRVGGRSNREGKENLDENYSYSFYRLANNSVVARGGVSGVGGGSAVVAALFINIKMKYYYCGRPGAIYLGKGGGGEHKQPGGKKATRGGGKKQTRPETLPKRRVVPFHERLNRGSRVITTFRVLTSRRLSGWKGGGQTRETAGGKIIIVVTRREGWVLRVVGWRWRDKKKKIIIITIKP